MKTLLSLLAAALVACATSASATDLFAPRVFDIVPPAGATVEMVDDLTVLRQPGTTFGAVLSFSPESGVSAWIPLAVLNSGSAPLKVGTDDVSARFGETALKVWSTTGLVRDARKRRDEMLRSKPGSGSRTTRDNIRQSNAAGALASVGARSPRSAAGAGWQAGSNDEYEARRLADAQFEALRERLFKDQTIEPRAVARGDIRIGLPPRRQDGEPTEFVLTLAFGDQTMDVLYRERDPHVEVGDAQPAGD